MHDAIKMEKGHLAYDTTTKNVDAWKTDNKTTN